MSIALLVKASNFVCRLFAKFYISYLSVLRQSDFSLDDFCISLRCTEDKFKHRHRRNVTSHHFFSVLRLFFLPAAAFGIVPAVSHPYSKPYSYLDPKTMSRMVKAAMRREAKTFIVVAAQLAFNRVAVKADLALLKKSPLVFVEIVYV